MSIIVQANPYISEPGTYNVVVDEIDFVDNPFKEGQQQLEVSLHLSEDSAVTTRFYTSPSLHPKGKLMPFCEALLKRSLTEEELREGFDIEILLGGELRVVMEEAVSKEGEKYMKVADFLSAAKKAKDDKEDVPF